MEGGGSIVWVRRRNGSWWPAKILDAQELSAIHVTSPRSGTPVKLLGREDASVDWYNLERSKRVKPFRCGDFDDCILKAEKLQGSSIRKREKYARREDAIIHALELEKDTQVNTILKELPTSSQRRNGTLLNLNSHSVTKGLASFVKDESTTKSLYARRGQQDIIEATPRIRGLQHFGLRIAPKRKSFVSAPSHASRNTTSANDHVHVPPTASQSLVRPVTISSTKSATASKRKRTQGGLVDESLNKRRDRRRPLHQVLQNSAQLSAIPASHSDGDVSPSMLGEKEHTGVIIRAKRSQCVYLPVQPNDNLDFTEFPSEEMQLSATTFGVNNCPTNQGSLKEENTTSILMEEAKSDSSSSDQDTDEDVLSESTETQLMGGPSNGCIEGKSESTSSEELLDESMAVNAYSSIHHPDDQAAAAADAVVSKWKLKGKRNIRYIMRRSNESVGVTCLEGEGKWSDRKALRQQSRYDGSEVLDYDYDEDEMIEKNSMRDKMIDCGIGRYPSKLKGLSKDHVGGRIGIVNSEEVSLWETDGLSKKAFRGYLDKSGCPDPIYDGSCLGNAKKSVLVDVDLKVQASYQGEHVPLVSLMSRLNGKAIIGHPIQIEALEDGSSEMLLSTDNDFREATDNDGGGTSVAPAWRTGPRTVMHRTPRPHPSTGLDADSPGDLFLYSDPESKHACTNSHVLHPDQVAGKSHDVCRPTETKRTRRPTKKANFSSRKTRTLSSIATEQRVNCKAGNQKAVKRNGLDGLMKPANGSNTVTCIPVKLVFSRLLEAVGRPPSRPGN